MDNKGIIMTKGPILVPLIRFILPLIGTSLFQQLYNTVDFLFVGNVLNKTSAAAVGASSTLVVCCIGLFSGIAVGTSVVMSQRIGSKDLESASKVMHSSITFGLIGGLIFTVLGIVLAPSILAVLNTPQSTMPEAVLYVRIYFLSLPMLVFYNICAGSLNAMGNSKASFKVLATCGFVNVAADAVLLILIPLGVLGVALATAVSQGLSATLIARELNKSTNVVSISFKKLGIDFGMLKKVLRIGLPAGIQTIIITFSNIIVQYYINAFGEIAVAAFATYFKVETFMYLPILAFGQAATTFSGQNTGAGQYKRIRKGTIITAIIATLTVLTIAVFTLAFSEGVFGLFMKDKEVVSNAVKLAFVTFPFYWIYPLMEVSGAALRGMGYSISSMVIVISNLCVIRILLLMFFSKQIGTLPSLATVYPLSWAGGAICFVVLFFIVINKKIRKSEIQSVEIFA
ncbi:putative efflux protein, MATE family [Acetitomaculum ruminis DSM 5522]|uniref:Putative efflux protein, MATE family n=1 Tax=Acetitomaculum ruminis DSM 5522 TaxID=1120918 RepID=A0A1I1A9Y5_9FIRM|nr:MATE family efflux transporter [Acetitomaculum ruminis]SFB34794.1 putative efflux protein, MATE family [Acetitomaculum ruminis DSM 5522]